MEPNMGDAEVACVESRRCPSLEGFQSGKAGELRVNGRLQAKMCLAINLRVVYCGCKLS